MTTASPALSRSVEDYLKAIYRLSRDGLPAPTSQIAEQLAVAPASVSGMVKRLSEQGLLEHERYRGAMLTEAGRRGALKVLRRHRLIEAYLVAALGYRWDTVHDEAERLEHAVSDELVERMAAALGHPSVDPHGDPIPTADGRLEEEQCLPLADLEPGTVARIHRVRERDPEFLRHLASLGLTPGADVLMLGAEPFHGPITIQLAGERRVIGHELASTLLCTVEEAS